MPPDRRVDRRPARDLHQAHTGDDAIDGRKYEPFDLVISDINLNGPDSGLDVRKRSSAPTHRAKSC